MRGRNLLIVVLACLLLAAAAASLMSQERTGVGPGVPGRGPGRGGGPGPGGVGWTSGYTLTDGLVAFYELDESANGTNPTSRAPTFGAYTLTDSGTYMPSTPGYFGNAARGTSGTADYLVSNDAEWGRIFMALRGATISFMHRWNAVLGNASVGVTNNGGCSDQVFVANTRASDRACFAYVNANVYTITGAGCLPNDTSTWRHLVFVFDGLAAPPETRIYADGVQLSTTVANGPVPPNLARSAAAQSFLIGKACGLTYGSVDYDRVAIWSRALSGTEVARLFGAGGRP